MPAPPRSASPRTQRKRPGDLTGTEGQKLAAAAAKAKADEAKEESAALAAEKEAKRNSVIDYTGSNSGQQGAHTADDVVTHFEVEEDEEVEVAPKTERIKVTYPIDDMTFGREVINPGDWDEDNQRWAKAPVLGNLQTYSFEEGPTYEVPKALADHLRSLGYVYEY